MKTEKEIIEEMNIICDHNKRICNCILCRKEFEKTLQSERARIKEEIGRWWEEIKKSNIKVDEQDEMTCIMVSKEELNELLKVLEEK